MDLKEIGFYSLSDDRVIDSSPTSQMKRCEIIITEYCNFSCPYCRGLEDWVYDRKLKQLSLKEVKNVIDDWCKDLPLENIRFSGGEPTMHKDLHNMVSYAKTKGINRIAVSTNGSASLDYYKTLIYYGVNDFSISLDGCCVADITKMSGGVPAFDIITSNIKALSKLTYVTVGVVLNEENVSKLIDTMLFADELGVSDIRVISAAQYNETLKELVNIPSRLINKYPILKYRVNNLLSENRNVRGITKDDSCKCGLMLDDSVVAGNYHFPCVIYMREKGKPIGKVSDNMRKERIDFYKNHNSYLDPICRKNCLDVCIDYNNKFERLNKWKNCH